MKSGRFDILGITESHLDFSDTDHDMFIDGYKFTCLDRTKCSGEGCVIYYADHLKVVHRNDLVIADFDAIRIQVKFPMRDALFAVAYRSDLEAPNFFNDLNEVLEKAWLKSNNIFLLTDTNCDLLHLVSNPGIAVPSKTSKLSNIFDSFSLHNVINKPTRITLSSQSLFDLI